MMRVIAGTARGKNLAALPGEDVTSRVIPDDAFHFLATTQEEFDLALLDPPYHHGTVAKALPQLAAHMAPGGVVLCETELDAELPEQVEGLVLAKQYKYGKILVSRYEKEEQL